MVRRSSRHFIALLTFGALCGLALAGAVLPTSFSSDLRAAPALPAGGSIISTMRSDPSSFNWYVDHHAPVETIAQLTQSRLFRVNRATMEVEPMLAESWTRSKDNLTYTVKLRRGVKFSDGVPFTSADVVFSFNAIYAREKDGKGISPIGDSLQVGGKPLEVSAVDDATVTIRFPSTFGPALRVLDNLPIYPKHLLEQALKDGSFAKAWDVTTPPEKMAGLGPFVLKEYRPKERLVFDRNPNYWRKDASGARLPYLDRITIQIVADQNAEMLLVQSGQADCTQDSVRPDDYAVLKQAEAAGKLRVHDLGPALDGDALWFNLRKDAKIPDARRAWLQSVELRRAINEAVDRARFANTVFFGAAVPAATVVSPANHAWFDTKIPAPAFDRKKAAARLASIGLKNKNADGVLVDGSGAPVRFTLLTMQGNTALQRGAEVLRDDLRTIGVGVDVVPLQQGALISRIYSGEFEAIYFRFTRTDLDPALSMDFWASWGDSHMWNLKQPPAEWEKQVDDLLVKQAATMDPAERKRLFNEVQRIYADQVPILYFALPRVFVATTGRLLNVAPSLIRPMVLWSADTLAVKKAAGTD